MTTRWLGRPGRAVCGEESCVSVACAARALLRARFAAPKVDLDDIVEDVGGVVCGLLCVVAFRWACDLWSSEVFSVLGCQ